MLRLYGFWRSAASFRVRMALNLKGIPFEEEMIDLDADIQHGPAYTALNPQAALPSLVIDAGPPLTQSLAILEYLEETHPTPPLLPADPRGRARVRSLALLWAADHHPLIVPRVRRYLAETLGQDEAARTAWLRHWFREGLAIGERRLAAEPETGRFCHGDDLSFADLCLLSQAMGARGFGVDFADLPTIARIVAACLAIDPIARALPLRQPALLRRTDMSLTQKLCEKITAVTAETIGEDVIAAATPLVIDGLAVAIAGARSEPAIKILADHFRHEGSIGNAVALGCGFRLGAVQAATLNGAAMHVLDFEPMWSPPNHAVSTTLPAILALAGSQEFSGHDLLVALIKGIELQARIRFASGHVAFDKLLFHPPGFVGPLGAATAAAHLLGLDAAQLAHAIGIACSRAGGVMSNVGSMTKSTHPGYAVGLGLESALLAARGFTANPSAFEAPQGFAEAFLPPSFNPAVLEEFGEPFRITDPGYALKMYPSQFGTHYAITAGLRARPGHGTIESVRLVTPPMRYVDRPRPKTGLEGKFSLQYTLAAALLDGAVGMATFTDRRLAAADMQDMLGRIELVSSPDIPDAFGIMHVDLELRMADGRIFHERCDGPPGSWGQPPLDHGDHLAKIRECLATGLPPLDVDRLIDLAARVDHLDSDEIRTMLDLAAGP